MKWLQRLIVALLPVLAIAFPSQALVPVFPTLQAAVAYPSLGVDSSFAPKDEESQRLGKKIDELVRTELTQHWYPHAVNRRRGGFHQTMARDWSLRPDEDVFLVYQARMTWTAAAFAGYSPAHRQEFEGYARHGIEFLDQVMRDKDLGGFHWVLGPDGRLDAARGDEKHVYGIAFVIYAASKVRELLGDEQSLRVARDAFDWLEEHAHDATHGGYFEALRRDGTPIVVWNPDQPISRRVDRLGIYFGYKTMNVHIHLLEALTELSKIDDRPVVKERLSEVFAIVRDRIAVEPGALNLYLTRDWRAIPAHDSFGHDIETAFLLIEAAHALGKPEDPKAWQVARMLVDHALDWGWDGEHGGFYDKGESFAGAAFDRKKVWWTEAEGLNALLLLDQKYGKGTDRYWKAFLKQWGFIEKHMLDPQHGGWYSETTENGTLSGGDGKANPWKANYHTSRALMNVARMLKQPNAQTRLEPSNPASSVLETFRIKAPALSVINRADNPVNRLTLSESMVHD
jgi:cellobiose epimerase